jgi:signal transduction histidine kinase
MFGDATRPLIGKTITRYIPALGTVPSLNETDQSFRAEMQCRGERENGEVFLANVFFSTYRTAQGPRLAALVMDASEHLRDREEASLEQLLAGSRILVAAVSHEVRNVCGAIGVIYENLARGGALNGNQDFEALGSLVHALSKIASLELKQSTARIPVIPVDVHEVLTDLRIVLEPTCKDAGIELIWQVPRDLPLVWADRHSLLQALLNLTKNSQRALEDAPSKTILISAKATRERLSIRINDSGPGIASPKNLFQPLQKGADANGLGLYLSRAFVRSFRGDLRHDPAVPGCSFVLDLLTATSEEHSQATEYGTHPASVA